MYVFISLLQMAEEEEIRRLRKELVPKAQPMPYFDRPFIPRRYKRGSSFISGCFSVKKLNADEYIVLEKS